MATQCPILLVDDEPVVADMLSQAASHSFPEAHFLYVTSYTEAKAYLDGLTGLAPLLVLLDLDLQTQLTRFDILLLIRHHPLGRLLPVVILTSSLKEEMGNEALLRGASAFTIKPFSYTGWKSYVTQLRTYWFQTVTTPTLFFDP